MFASWVKDYFENYVFSPLTLFVSGGINISTPGKGAGLPNQLLAQTDFPLSGKKDLMF